MKRLIFEPQKYRFNEPETVKRKNDLDFCKVFLEKKK